jgi:hypothetical protein
LDEALSDGYGMVVADGMRNLRSASLVKNEIVGVE